ncbi:helix-turn-helix domain-containing protein [Chachezhania antarctica]|uniref:helix-turn-helix domain-containing protein n=1 Tax=Chachezhania antarctica TaxID=2340860 RepID=UPI000EAD0FA4|nr:helix-turn-helix transcriptional regulator [Chachezhania antarctica]
MIARTPAAEHGFGMSIKPDSLLPPDVWQAMKNEAVGHRLRLLRRALGMSPSEMADSLGIERTYWSRYEKGRQGLSDAVAALLTIRFGVTLDFIMLGKWDKLPLDLAEKMRALPPE